MSSQVLLQAATDADRRAALERIVEQLRGRPEHADADRRAQFVRDYLSELAVGDLTERPGAELAELALSHLAGARRRAADTCSVRVFTPNPETDGWGIGRSVVQIVTDDRPFLVDSVVGALHQGGHEVHLLVHPRLLVRRDQDGVLVHEPTAVRVGPDGATPQQVGTVLESWIQVEITRESDPHRLTDLVDRLRQVLREVRVAVQDWPAMRERAQQLAHEWDCGAPATVDPTEVVEARALLRWMAEGNFIFLGYREYDLHLHEQHRAALQARPGSGLGILRSDPADQPPARVLDQDAAAAARRPHLLVLTKANSRSHVHRTGYLDYIGIKRFDAHGVVVGERRFLGLFASSAYTGSVRDIPVVRGTIERVVAGSGFPADSHTGKDLWDFLESYPRDELFEIAAHDLWAIAQSVLQLQQRRRTTLFVRRDTYGRFISCLVYLPRDRYATQVRAHVTDLLCAAIGGSSADFSVLLTGAVLARLHLVIRVPSGGTLPQLDVPALEAQIATLTRRWEEDLRDAAVARLGPVGGDQLVSAWQCGLSESYRALTPATRAVTDLLRCASLLQGPADALDVHVEPSDPPGAQTRRLRLYRQEPLTLTAVLPFLANLGVEVLDEHPHRLQRSDGSVVHLYDFGLRLEPPAAGGSDGAGVPLPRAAATTFADALVAAWQGRAESDGLDRLVLRAGLTWQEIAVLRAYVRYLRQIGTAFGYSYLADCLVAHAPIASSVLALFRARFDPDLDDSLRAARQEHADEQLQAQLQQIQSLDADRILRTLRALVLATVRTNVYRAPLDPAGGALAFSFDPAAVPDLPAPRPAREVFVYAPWVEGVHLRFGAVARGGLRWSDRREDFRTEVLGLVKAQLTKNVVIVPTGAKGGFVPKRLPDPAQDRDGWLAQGRFAYRSFVAALLDVTDNLQLNADGSSVVLPPPRVVRHNADDPYLVVAADKGTAAFSDLANEVAAGYRFWLADAFASGGSVGYDHKAMGITARGAWESVLRHLRELGHDVTRRPTTVVGIGDMSGDVFGNGMVLSDQLRLVAAFDHRHVFLDPDPDPAVSFRERQRLFALPRSGWEDYDRALISPGGGVWPRSATGVPIDPAVARALGLPPQVQRLSPPELIRAMLRAPVDLLWNGGIGTYVKAAQEQHQQVGDKANDSVRVDGCELRARVIGEGGNLGLTQRGRIEAAQHGVRVNTDAVDNSAGVACSDREVNIKILLARVVATGELDGPGRDRLLAEMTDEVSALVLRDNYEQNVLLGNARAQSAAMVRVHRRFLQSLQERGEVDRALEALPSDGELAARAEAGIGLTSPEFAVLMAYAKLTLKRELLATALPDDPSCEVILRGYFPVELVRRFGHRLHEHPLRREIVVTRLVNDMVNRGGITFVFRAQEETAAAAEQVARAYLVCRNIFRLDEFVSQVEALDGTVTSQEQARLYLSLRRLIDRAVRRLLAVRADGIDVLGEIERLGPVLAQVAPLLPTLLTGEQRVAVEAEQARLVAAGVPASLARRSAALLTEYSLLDIAAVAERTGRSAQSVAGMYLTLSARYQVPWLLTEIARLPRADRWQALARAALRQDVYATVDQLTGQVLAVAADLPQQPAQPHLLQAVLDFEAMRPVAVQQVRAAMSQVAQLTQRDLAVLSVAVRSLRSLAQW